MTIGQRRRLVLDQRVSDRTVEGVAGVTPPPKTRGYNRTVRIPIGVAAGCTIVSVALAQLPPEIMVDRHLIRAERLLSGDESGAALAEMDTIIALREKHDLEVPGDFDFKYAEVAFAAGRAAAAIASLNDYLLAAGRSGEFYRQALELLDKAEEAKAAAEAAAAASAEFSADDPSAFAWFAGCRPMRLLVRTPFKSLLEMNPSRFGPLIETGPSEDDLRAIAVTVLRAEGWYQEEESPAAGTGGAAVLEVSLDVLVSRAYEGLVAHAVSLEFRKPVRDAYERAGLAATVSQDRMFSGWLKDAVLLNVQRMVEDFIWEYEFVNRSACDAGAL